MDSINSIRSREALTDIVSRGTRVKYVFFWGHQKSTDKVSKSCFSQWYDSPFDAEGKQFLTAEHYMMYQKAVLFGDTAAADKVLLAKTPGEAKSIGRGVKGFNETKWLEHRFDIVTKANLAKFSSDPALKSFLLDTGSRVLVEASPVDKIWGIGLAADDARAEQPGRWKGLNLLGFALMEVREQLRKA